MSGRSGFSSRTATRSSANGRRHLEHVLRVYRQHYKEHRPHRALRLQPPDRRDATPLNATGPLRRRDLVGGLIHEYEAA
jgi:putative transposase